VKAVKPRVCILDGADSTEEVIKDVDRRKLNRVRLLKLDPSDTPVADELPGVAGKVFGIDELAELREAGVVRL
jgi:hypothetical protein